MSNVPIALQGGPAPVPSRVGHVLGRIEYEGYLLAMIVVMGLVLTFTVGSSFWSSTNLSGLLLDVAIVTVPAIGMTLVIVTRGIDVSIGSLVGVVAVVAGLAFEHHLPFVLVLLIGIAVGVGGGLVNGAIIAWGKVPPIIVTLGTLSVFEAITYLLLGGVWISNIPAKLTQVVVIDRLGPVPYSFVVAVALVALFSYVMARRPIGLRIYAAGDNPEAARTAGLAMWRIDLFVYALLGGLTAIAALMTVGQSPLVMPTTGQNFELTVIAAAVVGGTNILGGEGKVVGGLLGAFLVEIVEDAAILYHVNSFYQQIVLGAMIVGGVSIGVARRRRRRTEGSLE
ncbi:MAG: ABC transporter permease [Actinomycetota bacterium]|nr:ABC transporter permease [Actinomycetota bacterium]MDA8075061.1 ABC transporter permease [Actinomycetota bacterium]